MCLACISKTTAKNWRLVLLFVIWRSLVFPPHLAEDTHTARYRLSLCQSFHAWRHILYWHDLRISFNTPRRTSSTKIYMLLQNGVRHDTRRPMGIWGREETTNLALEKRPSSIDSRDPENANHIRWHPPIAMRFNTIAKRMAYENVLRNGAIIINCK